MSKHKDQIIQEAADWLVKLDTQQCSTEDLQQFEQWIQQSSKHQEIFDKLKNLTHQLGALKEQKITTDHHLIQEIVLKKKTTNMLWKGGIFVVFLSLFSLQQFSFPYWLADVHTQAQEWKTQYLIDDSQILMAGKTAYNVDYNKNNRKINLIEGNILVSVTKDSSRPFIVDLGDITVEALGTKFIVSYSEHDIQVNMLESKTKISSKSQQFKPFILTEGQSFIFNNDQITITKISSEIVEKAWNNKKLVIYDMPLDQVLDLLEPYQKSRFIFNSKKLSHYKVSAVLPLDQADTALALLQDQLPLNIQKIGSVFTLIY